MAELAHISARYDEHAPLRAGAAIGRVAPHSAFSLLELVAVVFLLGLMTVAAIGRFGSTTLENLDAAGYAERIALDLKQARERTIATGDNHYLDFTVSGGEAASYVIMRRTGSGDVAVAPVEATPAGLAVSVSNAEMEFEFDGSARDAYVVNVASADRTFAVTVALLTGAVKAEEVAL